jgi:hypothetical protein
MPSKPAKSSSASAPVAAAPAPAAASKPAPAKKEAPVVAAAPVVEATESSVQTREERHKSFLASVDSQLAVLKALRAQAVANFKADNNDFKSAAKSGRRRRAPASSGQENAVKVA